MKYWLTRDWLLLLPEVRYVTWHPAVMYPEITKCINIGHILRGKWKKKRVFFWAKDTLISPRIIVHGYCRNVWVNGVYCTTRYGKHGRPAFITASLAINSRNESRARTSYVKYYLSSADIICRSRNVMNRGRALRNSILSLAVQNSTAHTEYMKIELRLRNEGDIGMCSACNERWIGV